MDQINQAIAVIIGATISACVTILVVGVQHFLTGRRHELEKSAERFSSFYTTAHKLALRIGDLARAPMDDKNLIRDKIRDELADTFNSMISSIHLHDAHNLVEICYLIDSELISLTNTAMEAVWTREDWRRERSKPSDYLDVFANEARRYLNRKPLGLLRPRRLPLPNSNPSHRN